MLGLSPAEAAFVDALIEVGDAPAAAALTGVQPTLAADPRVQSAIVERIRAHGAIDAAYARKVLRDLAHEADQDGVRLRAATTLWERALGKVPDQVKVDVSIQHVSRASLYAEIRQLLGEIGLPPAIEGEFEEVTGEAHVPPLSSEPPDAGVAQSVEHAEPPRAPIPDGGSEVAGSSPVAGTPSAYVPALPAKWR